MTNQAHGEGERPGPPSGAGAGAGAGSAARRFWPVLVLAGGFAAFFAFGLQDYLSYDSLRDNREWLLDLVARHGTLAVLVYVGIYAAVVAFSVPGGTVMTVAGGFLFGSLEGTAYTVVAATLGATVLFLLARSVLGDSLRARAGPWLARTEAGFRDNALSYLLVLRLVPLFPFFVVNLVPAFFGVPVRTYVIATFFGIIPGTFVYAQVGTGLGSVFESGESLTLGSVLTWDVVAALLGLAALALLPVVYKRIRGRGR